jgi:hypothetical protein
MRTLIWPCLSKAAGHKNVEYLIEKVNSEEISSFQTNSFKVRPHI